MTTIIRPGQRIVNIPGIGLRVSRRAVSSGAANWWEAGGASGAVAVYQPKGAASLAASYVNLANPGTYDAAPGTAPTWASGTGWTFNGTTQYLLSMVTWVSTYSVLIAYSDDANDGAMLGGRTSGQRVTFYATSPGQFYNGSSYRTYTIPTSGVVGIADRSAYVDGVEVITNLQTWSVTPAAGIAIGSLTDTSALVGFAFWQGKIQAVAIYNTALTAPQVAAISSAMGLL